jgi:hypothetical protein
MDLSLSNVVYALLGGFAGYYASKLSLTSIASKAIDLYVDIKWKLFPMPIKVKEDKPVTEQVKTNFKWLSENTYYKMYEIDGKIYITFNHEYEPSLHFEEHTFEDIVIIKTDGTKANPSSLLIETLAKCGGHGCTYKSGVPTLEQLKLLPSPALRHELKDVKKIIVNTSAFEEHVIV